MLKTSIIFLYLILISLIDIRTQKIPNLLIFSAFICIFCFDLNEFIYMIPVKILNCGFYFSLLSFVLILSKGFGAGDVKLSALLAYNFSFLETSLILLIASIMGLIYFIILKLIIRLKNNSNKNNRKIPFAPFLTLGCFVGTLVSRRLKLC